MCGKLRLINIFSPHFVRFLRILLSLRNARLIPSHLFVMNVTKYGRKLALISDPLSLINIIDYVAKKLSNL